MCVVCVEVRGCCHVCVVCVEVRGCCHVCVVCVEVRGCCHALKRAWTRWRDKYDSCVLHVCMSRMQDTDIYIYIHIYMHSCTCCFCNNMDVCGIMTKYHVW